MAQLLVVYCRICRKDIQHGDFCELCRRILENLKRAKSARGISQEALYEKVRKHPLFFRYRAGRVSVPPERSAAALLEDRTKEGFCLSSPMAPQRIRREIRDRTGAYQEG